MQFACHYHNTKREVGVYKSRQFHSQQNTQMTCIATHYKAKKRFAKGSYLKCLSAFKNSGIFTLFRYLPFAGSSPVSSTCNCNQRQVHRGLLYLETCTCSSWKKRETESKTADEIF